QRRLREYHRSDVTSLDDAASVGRRPLALAVAQLLAYLRVGGDRRDGPRHFRSADLDRRVGAVDHDALADIDLQLTGEAGHRDRVLWIDTHAQGGERDRAVHGAG